jgi:hypothetical protein
LCARGWLTEHQENKNDGVATQPPQIGQPMLG